MAISGTDAAGSSGQFSAIGNTPAWYQEMLAGLMGTGQDYAFNKPFASYGQTSTMSLDPETGQPTWNVSGDAKNPFTQFTQEQLKQFLNDDQLAAFNAAKEQFESPVFQDYLSKAGTAFGQQNKNLQGALGQIANAQGQFGLAGGQFGQMASGLGDAASNLQTAFGNVGNANQYLSNATYNQNSLDQFLNPQTSAILSEIERKGMDQLTGTGGLLSQIGNQFTGAGRYGSKRQKDFESKTIADTSANIAGQKAQALQGAYDTAQKSYSDWANKGLQAGNQALQGALGQANVANSQAGLAGQYGNLGGMYGQLGQGYGALGQMQAGVGAQYGQLAQGYGSLGTTAQNLTQSNINALGQAGNQQMQIGQQAQNYDLQNWNAQNNFPWQQVSLASNLLQGHQIQPQNYSGSYSATMMPTGTQLGALGNLYQTGVNTGMWGNKQ